MKNSKDYSQKIHKLYLSLKRNHPKPQKVVYDEPLDALVYAVVSENISSTAAKSAIKRLDDHFVDLNDLRVSRTEEIVETLGEDGPVARNTASTLIRILGFVFNKYNTVCLDELKKIGKRSARQALEQIDGTSCFAVSYCMLTFLQGHAIPLTQRMIEYLKNNELVHPDADQRQIEGFLAKQISAGNAYGFYSLLRRQSELRRTKATKKATKKTTKTKTAAKTKKAKRKK